MWDKDSVYLKIESGYTFQLHKNDVFVNDFESQTFDQDGNESAVLKIMFYNPPNPNFQHLPFKGKVKNIEVKIMRNADIIDTLTTVDVCEIVKLGGKVTEICEDVFYQEKFDKSPLRRVIENLFTLKHKYKDENKYLMKGFFKLIMNNLYGCQIRKDRETTNHCISEQWMKTEYDENVLDYWKLSNENYIVKMKKDDGLDHDCDLANSLPAHLAAFLCNCR